MSSSEEHQEILGEVRQVRIDLVRHIEEDHDFMYRTDIEAILNAQTALLQEMATQQEIMATVLLGEKVPTYDGGWEREGGIKAIVDQYYNGGGGIRFDLPWGKLLAFLGTLITVGGGIIVAVIQTAGG